MTIMHIALCQACISVATRDISISEVLIIAEYPMNMKHANTYHHNRRIERMINVSLVLIVLFFMLLTGTMVIHGMR